MAKAPLYGQVVCGPPGSGKTTFCDGMQQYLKLLGREVAVVNLDPANEAIQNASKVGATDAPSSSLPYETLFDVCEEVINLTSVMEQTGLGPNGGLVYCIEYMDQHKETILDRIFERLNTNSYLILDLPGQVELYTHSTCVQSLLQTMTKKWDLRLAAVQLIDAQFCTDPAKFLSAALLGTTTMLRLELPTINVLSKIDLLSRYGELPMQLEYFTECHDLERLLPFVDKSSFDLDDADPSQLDYINDVDYQAARQRRLSTMLSRKHARIHAVLAEVVDDFGLLSFVPLDITDAESVGRVLARIDKCNGYVFKESSVPSSLFRCAVDADAHRAFESLADVQERVASKEEIEELRRTS